MPPKYNVAIIGCGLIGKRRAECAYRHKDCKLVTVVDAQPAKAKLLSEKYHCDWETDWRKAIADQQIDIVVVSTPNHLLKEITCAALKSGKDVLMEKPMGRNLKEALEIQKAVRKSGQKLKIGFNHRYHPAIQKAHQLFSKGIIGNILNIRCQYGHGARPGYEKEWRCNPKMSGGGELTDQGIHIIDLVQWFCGAPEEVFAVLQTAFWKIKPLEDNGFVIMKYKNGVVANFHTSLTQWKNLFVFDIFGDKGSLSITGLGGSYGSETLTMALRRKQGGAPKLYKEIFRGADTSWQKEWEDYISFITHLKSPPHPRPLPRGERIKVRVKPSFGISANVDEAVSVMQTLDAIYRSAKIGKPTFPFRR